MIRFADNIELYPEKDQIQLIDHWSMRKLKKGRGNNVYSIMLLFSAALIFCISIGGMIQGIGIFKVLFLLFFAGIFSFLGFSLLLNKTTLNISGKMINVRTSPLWNPFYRSHSFQFSDSNQLICEAEESHSYKGLKKYILYYQSKGGDRTPLIHLGHSETTVATVLKALEDSVRIKAQKV